MFPSTEDCLFDPSNHVKLCFQLRCGKAKFLPNLQALQALSTASCMQGFWKPWGSRHRQPPLTFPPDCPRIGNGQAKT